MSRTRFTQLMLLDKFRKPVEMVNILLITYPDTQCMEDLPAFTIQIDHPCSYIYHTLNIWDSFGDFLQDFLQTYPLNLRVDRHSTNQEVYSQDMANTTGLFECSRKGFAAAKPLSGYEPKLLTLCCSALRHGSGSIKVMR